MTASLPISSAACVSSVTLHGDWYPLPGTKNAGKSLFGPKLATHTPSVS